LKLNSINNDDQENLLKVSQIGERKVRCRLTRAQTASVWVIGPIGLETSMDEITVVLITEGYENATAQRIFKVKD